MTELTKEQKVALCAAVRTTSYSRKVISLLRDIADSLYQTDAAEVTTLLETSMDEDLLGLMRSFLKDVDGNDKIAVEESFRTIIDYLKDVGEVEFVVPVLPKKDFVKNVYDWCATNLSDEILINFTTNKLMDSGLVMTYKGNYYGYTLEQLLNRYFDTHDLGKFFVPKGQNNEQ